MPANPITPRQRQRPNQDTDDHAGAGAAVIFWLEPGLSLSLEGGMLSSGSASGVSRGGQVVGVAPFVLEAVLVEAVDGFERAVDALAGLDLGEELRELLLSVLVVQVGDEAPRLAVEEADLGGIAGG